MPRLESEEEDDALSPPGFTTPTKAILNDGAGHAEPDAEGTKSESDADVEPKYRFIKQWITREDTILEEA